MGNVTPINYQDGEISLAASVGLRYHLGVVTSERTADMNNVELVRHQYSYDPETGEFLWRFPPAKANYRSAQSGQPAGTVDRRDGARQLNLAGKVYRASRLAWLYVYGEWPNAQILYRDPMLPLPARDKLSNLRLAGTDEELTQARLHALLDYDAETGVFLWRTSRKGVRAGSVAAGLKNTGARGAYPYIRIDRVDYPAQRLAWLYSYGTWPASRLAFRDGDASNCRLVNLFESGFEHGTRTTPTINEEERRERQTASLRRHDLKRHFNLTAEEYQTMHDVQNGLCAICGRPETMERGGKVRWLAVDHDHKDRHVRDLLCSGCNVGLGNFADDPSRLRAAAAYLERHAALAQESVDEEAA